MGESSEVGTDITVNKRKTRTAETEKENATSNEKSPSSKKKTRTTESEKEPSAEKGAVGGLSKKRKTRSGESEKESSTNLDEGTSVSTKKTRVIDSGQEPSNVAVELKI